MSTEQNSPVVYPTPKYNRGQTVYYWNNKLNLIQEIIITSVHISDSHEEPMKVQYRGTSKYLFTKTTKVFTVLEKNYSNYCDPYWYDEEDCFTSYEELLKNVYSSENL